VGAALACLSIAAAALAQSGPTLAVGPDAGGYLCPDGRQLYVKSCFSEAPYADCAIVHMHLPMKGGYQVESRQKRAELAESVAGCAVYPLQFREGIVSLVAPKSAPAAKPTTPSPGAEASQDPWVRSTGADLAVVDGIAIGTNNTKSLLLKMMTVSPVFVDQRSRRAADSKGTTAIWVLTVWPKGNSDLPAQARSRWTEYLFPCKQQTEVTAREFVLSPATTYDTNRQIALDDSARVVGIRERRTHGSVSGEDVSSTIAQIACFPPAFEFSAYERFPNAAAAIANSLAPSRSD
jgi:hypothetical protein